MTTTETRAVDYSTARPSAAEIKTKGYVGVGRYIALGSTDKHLTRAEAVRLRARGLKIWLVAEGTANRATAGEAAGQADARDTAHAADAIGYPKTAPLFAAVDFDADPAQVEPYLRGWHAVLGARAGVYGGIRVIDAAAGFIPWRWQTAAWSAGKLSPHAHIYQRVTMHNPIGGCDENVICRSIPLWGGTLAPPASATQPHVRSTLVVKRAAEAEAGPDRIKAMHELANHPHAPAPARQAAHDFLHGHRATVAALDTIRKIAGHQ
jgi:hypothetical protein